MKKDDSQFQLDVNGSSPYLVKTVKHGSCRKELHLCKIGEEWNQGRKQTGWIEFDGKFWLSSNMSGAVIGKDKTVSGSVTKFIERQFHSEAANA